jgi:type I restriction enzyme S subunit
MRCDLAQSTPTFITFYFGSDHGRHRLLANTSSSGVPSIARPVTYLRSLLLPLPPIEVLNEFDRLVKPLLSQLRKNQGNIKSLAVVRDALLPKLISGEIRVGQAERVMMEAGV